MELVIKRAKVEEAETLKAIQEAAFADDLLKYQDVEGSPATESTERLIEKINSFYYYTIRHNDEIIGGVNVRKTSDTESRLSRLFLKPTYQNKGIGTKIIKFIEEEFPHTVKWSLDTPYLSYRNQHLYEKMGYKKIGEHRISDKLILFDYEKRMTREP